MRRLSLILLAGFAGAAAAQDVERGRLLYETHCGECHYERVHQRSPQRSVVRNLAELRDMVASRAQLTRYRFTLDDIESVVQYLNRSHYRFDK